MRPAASRLLLSRFRPPHHWVPSQNAAARFGSSSPRFWVPQKNGAEKGDIFMSYLNSVTIVGFVGADPEQRQARNNGSKFTVSFRRHATLLEKRRRRMGLESRVASHRDFPPSPGRVCSKHHQERRSRSRRGRTRQ